VDLIEEKATGRRRGKKKLSMTGSKCRRRDEGRKARKRMIGGRRNGREGKREEQEPKKKVEERAEKGMTGPLNFKTWIRHCGRSSVVERLCYALSYKEHQFTARAQKKTTHTRVLSRQSIFLPEYGQREVIIYAA